MVSEIGTATYLARANTLLRRRTVLAGLGAVAAGSAFTGLERHLGQVAPPASIPEAQIQISYGQSWRNEAFRSFARFGNGRFSLNPQPANLRALHVTNIRRPGVPIMPGPLPNFAGVNFTGTIDGITSYGPNDFLTIGRCAVLAQQLLRANASKKVVPIIEFCVGYGASTWTGGADPGGLQPGGRSWTNMLSIIRSIDELVARGVLGQQSAFRSVGYTQGGSQINVVAAKIADLTAMLNDFDGLNLRGTNVTGLKYYLGIAAPNSRQRILQPSWWATCVFCRTHAPGRHGEWSGRCFASTPWYQWPFKKDDGIHTSDYGIARHGEFEGYVKFLVEDLGVPWTPLWRSFTKPVLARGQTITLPFDRPAGNDFARSAPAFSVGDDPDNQIPFAPQNGFHVRRNGIELSVTPEISGMDVVLTVAERLNRGDKLEVSYAIFGPGGPDPGPHSGVWGNLKMSGPASVLFPGKSIDAWAWPFVEVVTV